MNLRVTKINPKVRNKALIVLVPFIVFSAFCVMNIYKYGVNTPFWDEWEMVGLFQKSDKGALGFEDLYKQHNEHRILFPNIVLFLSAHFTNWNIKAELIISFAFSLITALMLYLFILTRISRQYIALSASVLMSAWLYSPVQYENWLWGWQVEWFMCIAAVVSSIFFLDKFGAAKGTRRKIYFLTALLAAILATFSLGSGILVWLVGAGMLLLYRQSRKSISIWVITALATTLAYYQNYHKPESNPSVLLFLHEPADFVKYVLSYLGRPISDQPDVAILFGAILLLSLLPLGYAVWLQRHALTKFAPWLGLIFLATSTGVLTAVSRLGFGVSQATASRYTTFSTLYLIGITGLICTLINASAAKEQVSKLAVITVITISVPILFSSYANGLVGIKAHSYNFNIIKSCTSIPNPTDECLLLTYPNADTVRPYLEYLKQKGWAGY